MTLRISN
jgi:transposase, IS6 family